MSAAAGDEVEALFAAALELPPGDREGFLERACGGDLDLRRRVLRLLAAHVSAGGVMPTPVPGSPGAPLDDGLEGPDPLIGTMLGPFRLERRLGEGGMGVVYEARQENPSRVVAVKAIGTGLVTREAWRRFDAEVRAQGLLDHPAIVPILQAGVAQTVRGRVPYFAMPLVCGEPIDAYAARARPGVGALVGLLAGVCDGVAHAHAHGIIHRDLKPGNILVEAGEGGSARARVLDFGVAKALGGDGAGGARTLTGQVVGTPQYMSPEQAAGEGELVTTRSDVYALGVVAYEVLSGRKPYDVSGSSVSAAARVIGGVEPARLGSVAKGLRGDLETVVAKAMAKEPARRYQSASELGADLRRVLAGEPVTARPASVAYSARRFVGRHRVASSAVGAAVLAVGVGLGAAVWQAGRATAAARESKALLELAEWREYVSQVGAGKVWLDMGESAEAQRRLELAPARHRGWEWWALWRALDQSGGTVHPGRMQALKLAVDPTGRRVAVTEPGGAVVVADVASRAVVGRWWGAGEEAESSVEFSPDGERVLAFVEGGARAAVLGSADGGLVRWVEFPMAVWRCGFTGAGWDVWACDREGRVSVEGAGGRGSEPGPPMGRPAWRGSGRGVGIMADPDGRVRTRRMPGGEVLATLAAGAPGGGWVVGHAGEHAAALDSEGAVHVLDVMEGRVRRVGVVPAGTEVLSVRHDGGAVACRSPRGQLLMMGVGRDGPLRQEALVGLRGPARDAQFTPDGGRLWGTGSHVLKWWRVGGAHLGGAVTCRFTGDGALVVAMEGRGVVTLDQHTGAERAPTRRLPISTLGGLVWDVSADGRFIVVAEREAPERLRCFGLADGRELWVRDGTRPVESARFSPNGCEVFVQENVPGGGVAVLSAETGAVARMLPGSDVPAARGRAWFDGGRGYAVIEGGDAVLRSAVDGEEVGRFRTWSSRLSALSMDRGGRWVAAGSQDGVLRLWERQTGRLHLELRMDTGLLLHVQLDAAGSRVVVSGTSGLARLLETGSGREVLDLSSNRWWVQPEFSPDGSTLAGVSEGGTLVRLSAGGEAERLARGALERAISPSGAVALLRADATVTPDVRAEAGRWLAANPPDPEVLNERAWLIACCPGDTVAAYERAVKLAEAAVEVSPGGGFILNTLGAALLRAGRPAEAVEALQRAKAINQNFPVDDTLLALAFAAMGERASANEALDRAEAASAGGINAGGVPLALLDEARRALGRDGGGGAPGPGVSAPGR